MTDPIVFTLPYRDPPLRSNKRLHHMAEHRLKQDIRHAGYTQARHWITDNPGRAPLPGIVHIRMIWTVPTRHRRDADAAQPTPIALGSLACVILGWVMIGWRMLLFYRTKRQASAPVSLSPQQVMRNTRNALPDEYREWFDWTAELAGFEEPKRPAVVGRPQWNEAQHKGHDYMTLTDMYGTVDRYCVDTRKHEPTPKLPTVYRACPDNTCNTTYGPGAGWTHTDQHTWVEMQT